MRRLLRERRLVTLTGPGGSGKTRLALEAAGGMEAEPPGGVWLVELGALTDPALVPQTVAAALGVRESPGQDVGSALTSALGSREVLLLLTNCEHVVAACAELAHGLLSACAALRVLATSREALGVAGEAEPQLRSSGRPAALRALTLDLGNLRAALRWALDHDPELGLGLAGALGWFWCFTGAVTEGRRGLEDLLAASGRVPPGPAPASAHWSAGALAWIQGNLAAAQAHLDRRVALWRVLDDRTRLGHALTLAGLIAALRGEPGLGITLQEESVALLQGSGDRWGPALARYWLGETYRLGRGHTPVRAQYEASGALFREPWRPLGVDAGDPGPGGGRLPPGRRRAPACTWKRHLPSAGLRATAG